MIRLIAVVLSFGVVLAQSCVVTEFVGQMWAAILGVAALLCVLYLVVDSRRALGKWQQKMNMRESEGWEEWQQEQSRALENLDHSYLEIKKIGADLKRKIVILLVAVLAVYMGLAATIVNVDVLFSLLITGTWYLLEEFIYFFIQAQRYQTEEEELIITRETAPQLYDMVMEVWEESSNSGSLRIEVGGDEDVWIRADRKGHIVHMGIAILLILSKEEMRAVLRHEMAHILYGDTSVSQKMFWIDKLEDVLEEESKSMDILFLWLFHGSVGYAQHTYTSLLNQSTIGAECRADLYAAERGSAEDYMNASVKEWVYHVVKDTSKIGYRQLAEEKPSEHFYTEEFADFIQLYEEKKGLWDSMALKEIPVRGASHPTISQMMEKLGVGSYKIDFQYEESRQKAPEYYLEIENVLKECDENRLDEDSPQIWEEIRKEHYLCFKERVDRYESLTDAERKELPIEEKNDAAIAYRSIGEEEKAIKIFDEVLSDDPENTWALFMKGSMLLEDYREEGLEYVKRSLSNEEIQEDALESIFEYCVKTGNQKELDEFYGYAYELSDKYRADDKGAGLLTI